jgi:hypothetical protein
VKDFAPAKQMLMKNVLALMTLLVLLVLPVQAQRPSDAARMGLRGRVREVQGDLSTTRFNERGDITEILSQVSSCPKITYSYNDDGSRTVVKWCDGRATNSGEPRTPVPTEYKESYKFDSFGRMVEVMACPVQGVSSSGCEGVEYVYTERGFVVEELHHIAVGSQILRMVYGRDTQGRVRSTTTIGRGSVSTTFFSYAADEFPIESITYYPRGYQVERRITYRDRKFDAQNNWISVVVNDRNVYENGSTEDLSKPGSKRVISYREEENSYVQRRVISYY